MNLFCLPNQFLVLSTCLTLVLGGNLELSLFIHAVIVFTSHCVGTESGFWIYERIFNRANVPENHYGPKASSGFSFIQPLCISIILTVLGVCIQRIWPQSKKCAMALAKRISIFYVLFVLIAAYSYLFIMFGYSIIMQFDSNKDSSRLAANLVTILVSFFWQIAMAKLITFQICSSSPHILRTYFI